MKKFLVKLLNFSLIGLIPIVISAGLYFYFDPFKVLYDYDAFYENDAKAMISLNQDYVSTTTFIKNNKELKYNSFIFGNSRSIYYEIADWKKHLDSNASCFHFDASGESIYAIDKKIQFIAKQGNSIDNVLLILDHAVLIQDVVDPHHLFNISPALVDNSNYFEFHKGFFKAFLSPKFIYAVLDFKISNEVKNYMKNDFLLDDIPRKYNNKTNEIRFSHFENLIAKGEFYSPKRLSVFYERDTIKQSFSKAMIKDSQKEMLSNISSILKKKNTKVKIIINPLYDQLKLNREDLKYLNNLFGSDNVFDFSGINKFTNDYKNYYEKSHYRPHVSREIMNLIYKK